MSAARGLTAGDGLAAGERVPVSLGCFLLGKGPELFGFAVKGWRLRGSYLLYVDAKYSCLRVVCCSSREQFAATRKRFRRAAAFGLAR